MQGVGGVKNVTEVTTFGERELVSIVALRHVLSMIFKCEMRLFAIRCKEVPTEKPEWVSIEFSGETRYVDFMADEDIDFSATLHFTMKDDRWVLKSNKKSEVVIERYAGGKRSLGLGVIADAYAVYWNDNGDGSVPYVKFHKEGPGSASEPWIHGKSLESRSVSAVSAA